MQFTRYLRATALAAGLVAAVFTASPPAASAPPVSGTDGTDPVRVIRALERGVGSSGTAWGIDPETRQVVVSYDRTVKGAALARLTAVTGRFGDAVRVERLPGALRTYISGGDGIFGGGVRCTLAFNVANSAGTQYFLTAGHCTNVSSSWYAADQTTYLGTTAGTSFPGNDFGIVRYASGVSRPGNVNLHNGAYQDITSAGAARVGDIVCISSAVAGYRCGPVTALNMTVNYPQGTVYGLGRIDICSQPGDSGAPVFKGPVAVGIVSGGSGSCTSGGDTFFQPVTEALGVYGVHVY